MNSYWSAPSSEAFEKDNTVHLWLLNYKTCHDFLNNILPELSSGELERANKFYFEEDRNRYLITRSILKKILSRMLNTVPGQLRFEFNAYGKPFLKSDPGLFFNVSHSGNFGLIAITSIADIGVDVEKYRHKMTGDDVAKRFFSSKEISDYLNLNVKERQQGFFNCWTRKEAFIKAVGMGLSLPLNSFDVSLKPGSKAQITAIRKPPDDPEKWTMESIYVDEEYAAAYTLRAKHFKTKYWMACPLIDI